MNLRSRLSTLIAVRVVVSTLLLGSAILVQINRPGAFPIDPFFFLIGITYALSVLYLASLRIVERHPLDRRRCSLASMRFSSPRSFTSPAASPATSRPSTCCRSSPPRQYAFAARRAAGGGAERRAVPRARDVAVPGAVGIFSRIVAGAEPPGPAIASGSRNTPSRSICSGSSPWRCSQGRWPRAVRSTGARLEHASTRDR